MNVIASPTLMTIVAATNQETVTPCEHHMKNITKNSEFNDEDIVFWGGNKGYLATTYMSWRKTIFFNMFDLRQKLQDTTLCKYSIF